MKQSKGNAAVDRALPPGASDVSPDRGGLPMGKNDFVEIKGGAQCPICAKGRRCKISSDGNAVVCFRVTDKPKGHRVGDWVRKNAKAGGALFVRNNGEQAPPPSSMNVQDLTNKARRYSKQCMDLVVSGLAKELGVSPESLRMLGVGYTGQHPCFPERSAKGVVVGINRRRPDGSKRVGRGEKRGLVIPDDLHKLDDPVLIVEGPTDTAACLTMGLTAVGRPNNTGGAEMLASLLEGREVIVVGERDQKSDGRWPGRDGAIAVAESLAECWNRPIPYTLPPDGAKDVRDFLLQRQSDGPEKAGHELLECLKGNSQQVQPGDKAAREAKPPYRATKTGLVHVRQDQDGNEIRNPLTNFLARIVSNVTIDDGAETQTRLDIEASLCSRQNQHRFMIAAAQFPSLNWVIEQIGGEAVIYPGQMNREHARTAIQLLSAPIPTKKVYPHTGWRQLDGSWCFLHADGVIGDGEAEVTLEEPLQRYALPKPPTNTGDLQACIRASLEILDVGPDTVTVPVIAAAFRAVLGEAYFSVHMAGESGTLKTAFAAVVQQHFGAGLDAEHLPGSWESTDNALEGVAFLAKDVLMVVDDYVPVPGIGEQQRQSRKADRLLRGAANRQGRGRMRADTSLRPARYPRALLLSTGEDVPRGQSLRARMLVVEVSGDDGIDSGRLSECQQAAAAGILAQAMAAFITWLAPRYEAMRRRLVACVTNCGTGQIAEGTGRSPDWSHKERPSQGQEPSSGPVGPVGPVLDNKTSERGGAMHRRTPRIVLDLYLGIEFFLQFATEMSAVTDQRANELRERAWTALVRLAAAQASHQAACEPIEVFINLLNSALSSGRAHIANREGAEPENAAAFGWRDGPRGLEAKGDRIGWIDEDGGYLFLDPEATFAAAQRMGSTCDGLTITQRTLHKRLHEKGLLARVEKGAKEVRFTVRECLEGKRRRVLCLRTDSLEPEPVPPVPPVPDSPDDPAKPDSKAEDRDRSERPSVPKVGADRPQESSNNRHVAQSDGNASVARVDAETDCASVLASAGLPADVLVFDFESFHDTGYNLKKLSVVEYVHDTRFHAFGVAVRWPDGRTEFRTGIKGLLDECSAVFGQGWKNVTVAGHNLAFDAYILQARYGVIPRQMVDTLSLARHVWPGWGNSLGEVADRCGLRAKGDTAATLKGIRNLSASQLADLAAYAEHDAELTFDVLQKLLPQITRPDVELRLIDHTLRLLVERGVRLDVEAAKKLREQSDQQLQQILAEAGVDRTTGGGRGLVQLLEDALAEHGENVPQKPGKKGAIPALAKTDEGMKRLLTHKSERVRSLAQARLAVKSAPAFEKRIGKLLNCAGVTGGVIPVPLTYYGAHTGRFSGGGGVNLQNLPARTDGPAGKLRGLIIPPEEHRFVIVDADKIEARVLAWVAQQQDLVKLFAEGRDVYSDFAGAIFGEEVRKARPEDPSELQSKLKVRRQLGKTAILGLGYGMGAETFIDSVRNDLDLASMLNNGTLTESFLGDVHRKYRRTYRAIPRFWAATETAFLRALSDGTGKCLEISFTRSGDAVYIELPSTRRLVYRKPSISTSSGLTYVSNSRRGEDGVLKETRKRLFGGLLTENIVQAIARDLLVDAMLRLEKKGYKIVLHVHDELVVQVPQAQAKEALEETIAELSMAPEWAEGLPLDAEGHVSDRYSK